MDDDFIKSRIFFTTFGMGSVAFNLGFFGNGAYGFEFRTMCDKRHILKIIKFEIKHIDN